MDLIEIADAPSEEGDGTESTTPDEQDNESDEMAHALTPNFILGLDLRNSVLGVLADSPPSGSPQTH